MKRPCSPIAQSSRHPIRSSTLLVRAPTAEPLRAGLCQALGVAGEQIALGREERQAEACTERICHAARSLLEEVGRGVGHSPAGLDMGKRRDVVLRVLRQELNQALERMRDATPAEQFALQRSVLELGDYALHLQSLDV